MKIIILSSNDNWIHKKIDSLVKTLQNKKNIVKKIHHHRNIKKCEILFILGYHKIIPEKYLELSKTALVIHESNLPKGRGWSPMTWDIIRNKKKIYFTLFNANKKIDCGDIFLQKIIDLNGTELYDDIKNLQYSISEKLCLEFIKKYPKILTEGRVQKGKPTYYKRRYPIDSKVLFNNKISEIFNLLRISSFEDYPVYFTHKGKKFKIKLENYEKK